MARAILFVVAVALVEGVILLTVFELTPVWTFLTVAGATAILVALLVLRAAWSRHD